MKKVAGSVTRADIPNASAELAEGLEGSRACTERRRRVGKFNGRGNSPVLFSVSSIKKMDQLRLLNCTSEYGETVLCSSSELIPFRY